MAEKTSVKIPTALLLVLLVFTALAQPRFEYRAELAAFQQRFSHMTWQLEYPDHTERLEQSYLPVSFDLSFGRNSHLTIGTAGGWSNAVLSADYELKGMTDTFVRFSQRFGDRWMLGAGLNLPTGQSKLDYEENVTANRLTETILGFPWQRLGVGMDLEFSLAHALNLSETSGLGLGATVIVPGEFEFRQEQNSTYKPGARYVITTTFNHLGTPLKWRLNFLGQLYGKDQFDGHDSFRQGAQFEPSFAGEWRFAHAWECGASLHQIWKADNEVFGAAGTAKPAEHFYIDNSTFVSVHLNHNRGRRLQAGAVLGWNHFGESNQQLSRATVWRYGLQGALKISEHLIVNAAGDYATGQAENGTIDLRGYGLVLGLAARF